MKDMLKYHLELSNLENKFNLNNFGNLKSILMIENIVCQLTNAYGIA